MTRSRASRCWIPPTGPRPLLTALASRPAPAAAGYGLHPVNSPWASYSGLWTFGDAGADFGWINDSQVRFDFAGEEVALLLREGNYVAWLYATVDGEPANALPRDADGRAYLTLTSATRRPTRGPGNRRHRPGPPARTASNSPPSNSCRMKSKCAGPSPASPWASLTPAAPWNRQALAGAFATFAAALALLVSARNLPLARIAGRIGAPPRFPGWRPATRPRRARIPPAAARHAAHLD